MPCPWKANVFTILLETKTKATFFLNNTHNYWLKFQISGGKHNQKASKTTHIHQVWKHTYLTSPSSGLVFRSPPRKQILKLQANKSKTGHLTITQLKKNVVRKIRNNIQNIIHLSCLPLNSNFSYHIKDTIVNRKRYPYLYASQYLLLHPKPL